jgi:hypothetical protein
MAKVFNANARDRDVCTSSRTLTTQNEGQRPPLRCLNFPQGHSASLPMGSRHVHRSKNGTPPFSAHLHVRTRVRVAVTRARARLRRLRLRALLMQRRPAPISGRPGKLGGQVPCRGTRMSWKLCAGRQSTQCTKRLLAALTCQLWQAREGVMYSCVMCVPGRPSPGRPEHGPDHHSPQGPGRYYPHSWTSIFILYTS